MGLASAIDGWLRHGGWRLRTEGRRLRVEGPTTKGAHPAPPLRVPARHPHVARRVGVRRARVAVSSLRLRDANRPPARVLCVMPVSKRLAAQEDGKAQSGRDGRRAHETLVMGLACAGEGGRFYRCSAHVLGMCTPPRLRGAPAEMEDAARQAVGQWTLSESENQTEIM
eukprot:6693525-Prymnesium_polylepis.1